MKMALAIAAAVTMIPSAAVAECAWVLWAGEWYDASISRPSSLLHASATQADCLAAMGRAAQAYTEKMGSDAEIGRDAREPWALVVLRKDHSVLLRCLPDTVDPRAPKGGAR
jgi:hypothetical protein